MKQYLFELLSNNQQQIIINIDYTINSGQVFLWEYDGKKRWYGVNGQSVLAIDEDSFKVITSNTKNSFDFFRSGDDYSEKILKSITKDKIVKSAVRQFPGLRLLRQDPFQCYISFILSSNSSIQNIKHMLRLLCKKFGKKVSFQGKEFFLFPEPAKLAMAEKNELQDCRLGYRANSVKKSSIAVTSGMIDFDLLKKVDYHKARESLLEVYGIGSKIADCISLFSLDKLEAFPLDRWMLRILQKYYSNKLQLGDDYDYTKPLSEKKYESLHPKLVKYFGPYAGYSQQFLYKMERELYQKKWL